MTDAPRLKLAILGLVMALAMSALEFTIHTERPAVEVLRWIELLLMVGVYWRGYTIVESAGSLATPTVVAFAGIFALLGLFLPHFEWSDLSAYANYGWLQHHYGLNPDIGELRILNALILTLVPMVWIGFAQWAEVKSMFVRS